MRCNTDMRVVSVRGRECAQAKRSVSLVMMENDDPKAKNEGTAEGGGGTRACVVYGCSCENQ